MKNINHPTKHVTNKEIDEYVKQLFSKIKKGEKSMKTYKIIRMYQDDRPTKTIKTGLTLEEAQEHCQDPSTSGEGWFDGYNGEDE